MRAAAGVLVALEHDDLLAVRGEHAAGGEAADSGADHHDAAIGERRRPDEDEEGDVHEHVDAMVAGWTLRGSGTRATEASWIYGVALDGR